MTTERITLTLEPVQITTGTETAYVQADSGVFRFADSDTKPADLSLSAATREATFSPPFSIWIWAGSSVGAMATVIKK